MVDYIKKKIVEKLARFTKNLKPSDISVSFLSGKGHLSNLELNAEFISEALQLPSWVSVSRVLCDTLRARVPFTNLKTEPLNFYIGQVLIDITTATQDTSSTSSGSDSSSSKLLNKLGGNPSKYGLIEKVIDGMRVEVRSVLIYLKDPNFYAQLEMTDILLQSTSPEWQQVPLNKSRVYLDDEDSVINYKLCTWSSLKIEGWSTVGEKQTSQNQLRLIVGATSIRIVFKRRVSDSSLMYSRISMHLGDLLWILTQSQLRAVSRLVQSLMDAAVRTQQLKRIGSEDGGTDSDQESVDSFDSVSSSNDRGKPISNNKAGNTKGKTKKTRSSRSSQRHEKVLSERMKEYMDGRRNLPSHEVIQSSFHLKTGKADLQLCDDTASNGVQGSLLIQVFQLAVDIYLDQPACSGRAHWNKANDVVECNTRWSRDLVTKASKTQYVDLPSIHLGCLRERGVVLRCADFLVDTLRNDKSKRSREHRETSLPVVTSDKKTFNIPDDVHNPAFQVGLSIYFYSNKYGNKFLVPRPNVYIYVSPVHVNIHQETCLWLVEFVYGVVRTINVELALSLKDEGKTFMEERKAHLPQVHQLPGLDLKFKILFTKITLPVQEIADDGRPKALQIETAAVVASNSPLHHLLGDSEFERALDVLREGWLLQSQDSPQFPHYDGDLRALPARLRNMLQHKARVGRRRGEKAGSAESSGEGAALAPEETRSEMSVIEGWHVSTSCVQVSFVSTLTHHATLYTTPLINDFPVNAWVFMPPSSLDADLHTPNPPSGPSPSDSPQTLSDGVGDTTCKDPRLSFVVHIATPMRVEIARLQLLFLMRLKDSLTAFKSSLMRFLDPEALSPDLKDTLEARSSSKNQTDNVSIAGCVAISSVEASLLLPSLYTSRPSQATNTDSNYSTSPNPGNGERPSSNHTQFPNINLTYTVQDEDSESLSAAQLSRSSSHNNLTGSINTDDHSRTTPNSAHLSASTSLGSLSTTGSDQQGPSNQATLTSSLGRRGSVESIGAGGRTPSPSGSLASLPVILEDDCTGDTSEVQARTGLSHMPPARSVSAVDLPLQERLTASGSSFTASGSPDAKAALFPAQPPGENSSPGKLSDDEFVVVNKDTSAVHPAPSNHQQQQSLFPPSCPPPRRPPPPPRPPGIVSRSPGHATTALDSNVPRDHHSVASVDDSSTTDHISNTSHTSPTNPPSISSKSSLLSRTSQRRQKTPAPLRSVPKFILHAEVRHICVLPNIRSGAITARVAVDSISVRELTGEEYEGMKEMAKKQKRDVAPAGQSPAIKARLEVGSQVMRFYPADCSDYHDSIVLASAEGLDLSLLLPNIAVLKDFFDDEFQAEKPLPLHVKVAGTRAVLMESIEHGADHIQSIMVGVDQLELHKGRELAPGLDIFREDINRFKSDGVASHEDTIDSCDGGNEHQLLLNSFSQFKAAFETHVHVGPGHLPPHTIQLLQSQLHNLHAALVSPPPPYTPPVVTTRTRSSTSGSGSSEMLHLRRELESLRHVQRESERMSAQVKESQIALDRQMADFLMVTDECKRVKEELVSYKQVMEKQQEHVERLLTENFDLRRLTDSPL